MKIQLDTTNKTITIEEDINLNDFMEKINILLPGGEWREFTLKMTKITEWRDPIVVPNTAPTTTPTFPNPWETPNPWTPNQPWYTWTEVVNNNQINTTMGDTTMMNYDLIDGKYNIEVI